MSNKTSTRNVPIAVTSDANNAEQPTPTPLAAIFPTAQNTENSFSKLSGDSLSSVSTLPHLLKHLKLHKFHLPEPELVSVAIDAQKPVPLTHYVKLSVSSHDNVFTSAYCCNSP